MALALPLPSAFAQVMPKSSSMDSANFDCRIIVSTEPLSLADHRNSFYLNEPSSHLSPAGSDDDAPLSPITFMRNEEYERSRVSYIAPAPRPSSSPSSPCASEGHSPISPVVFTHPNLSSPSIASQPPPVFPTAGTQSLALRLRRPLPPLPRVDTFTNSGATEKMSRRDFTPATRSSPSSSDERDDDNLTIFSPGPSQSPATSTYTTASSESAGSSKAIEAFSSVRPKFPSLTIPVRSHSSPIPPTQMPLIGQPIINPHIAVTPASPAPPRQQFPLLIRPKKRTASATSIVLPSPSCEHEHEAARSPIQRAPSPAPSLTPSMSSAKSFTHTGKFTLKRITSRTRLFGRRTLSSASAPTWDDADSEDTVVVGHAHAQSQSGSFSMDDKMLRPASRARSESPTNSTKASAASRCCAVQPPRDDGADHPPRRLEIAEVTVTPYGDVWEARELHDVIPKLRQLRAPVRAKK